MNNQDVKTLPWPENIVADRHPVSEKWVLHYLTDAQAQACLSVMNAPTPREQELEAQNKALWELVTECEQQAMSARSTFSTGNHLGAVTILSGVLEAIQKAKKSKG